MKPATKILNWIKPPKMVYDPFSRCYFPENHVFNAFEQMRKNHNIKTT